MPPLASAFEPRTLITEDNIKKVLQKDKGEGAVMNSWKVVDFTKIGDNYVGLVTSVEIKYSTSNGEDCEVTYVVKLSSHKGFDDLDTEPYFFEKEGKFYKDLLPSLNKILTSTGQKPLQFPKCFLVSLEPGKEQFCFEDLRAKGFKMFDRRKSIDQHHIILIISELARLHSTSYLLIKNDLDGAPVASKYEWLLKDFMNFSPEIKDMFTVWCHKTIDSSVTCLEAVTGYEKAIDWLKSLRPNVEYFLTSYIQSKRFNGVCHGDCWNNNIMFRYNNEGHPVEVMMLDLQLAREASVATDLNSYLMSSVSRDVRKRYLDYFISLYHSSYKEVLERVNMPMHFTKEEIMQEYWDKNVFGALFALTVIPFRMLEPDEVPDMSGTDLDTFTKNVGKASIEKLDTNPLFKSVFLALFDELMEMGLIC